MTQQNLAIEGFEPSSEQFLIWSKEENSKGNVTFAWIVSGRIEPDKLKKAFQQTIDQNEALRTQLKKMPGLDFPLQVIENKSKFAFHYIDDLTENDLENFWNEEVSKNYDKPALNIVKYKPDGYLLSITLPSLFADRKSFFNVLSEIEKYYQKATVDIDIGTTEQVQFIQYSEWQKDCLDEDSKQSRSGKKYWNNLVDEIPQIKLPEEKSTTHNSDYNLDEVYSINLNEDITKQLSVAIEENVETSIIAIFQILLAKLSQTDRFKISYITNDRKFTELEQMIGLASKTLPIQCEVYDDFDFKELVEEVKNDLEEANRWQEFFALENVSESRLPEIGIETFSVNSVIWKNGNKFEYFNSNINQQNLKLKLNILKNDSEMLLEFHFDDTVFEKGSIARLGDYLIYLVEQVIRKKGNIKIRDTQILPEILKDIICIDWNLTNESYSDIQNVKFEF